MKSRRRFGSIRKLPSKRFQARYTGPDRKVHTAPETFDTKGDAEAWLAVEWAKVQTSGSWVPPAAAHEEHVARVATYFGAYAEEVIERRVADGKIRASTAALYRKLIRLHLGEFLKQPLSEIKTRQVAKWHASMSSTPSSRSNAYGVLSTVMHEALRDELIHSSPCRVSGGGAKKSTGRTASEDEVLDLPSLGKYLDAAPEKYRMALQLAFWCGLRSGEVRGLRRRDVDLKAGELTVAQQIVKLDGKNVVSAQVKTDAGHRTIAIPPHIIGVMQDWLAALPVKGRDALLFTSPTGGPMSGEALRAAGKKAATAIGRPNLRVHSLRHSSATLFAQSGATTADMMGRFGWSSPSMATRYNHAVRERDKELAERMSALAQN
jgi:integrase